MEKKSTQNTQKENCEFCSINKEVNDCQESQDCRKENKDRKNIVGNIVRIAALFLIILAGSLFMYDAFKDKVNKTSEDPDQLISGTLKASTGIPNNNDTAPEFTAEDINGNQFSLKDLRSQQPVLLVFWATWCTYCKQELPYLNDFTVKNQDKIKVLAVVSAETKESVKDYVKNEKVDFNILLDETREIWNEYGVRGTPAHFLINKEGTISFMQPGLATAAELNFMLTKIE